MGHVGREGNQQEHTDEESGTLTVVLKKQPVLSGDLEKPLSGITVAVCSGHGGPDPGALSPAGEYGVNEAENELKDPHNKSLHHNKI